MPGSPREPSPGDLGGLLPCRPWAWAVLGLEVALGSHIRVWLSAASPLNPHDPEPLTFLSLGSIK